VKKIIRIGLIIFAVLGVVGVVAIFIANSRYEFLFDAPKVSHETLITPYTSIRAVFQPPLAKPLVTKLLGDQAPPGWVLDRVMPYEAALMASPDLADRHFEVALFLNTRRLTPLIAEYTKAFNFQQRAPFLQWEPGGFSQLQPGVLSLKGTTDIDSETAEDVLAQWGVVTVPSRPALEGNHMGEISIDNRDGSLYAVIMLAAAKGVIELPLTSDNIRESLLPVATLYLSGDLQGDDELGVHLACECQPSAEEGEVTAVNFTLGAIIGQLTNLVQSYGADLRGSKRADGATITGDYIISNFSRLLGI